MRAAPTLTRESHRAGDRGPSGGRPEGAGCGTMDREGGSPLTTGFRRTGESASLAHPVSEGVERMALQLLGAVCCGVLAEHPPEGGLGELLAAFLIGVGQDRDDVC